MNSVFGPAFPACTFLPMRLSRRLELNLEVTLALMDFFFFLPSTRFPMAALLLLRLVWRGLRERAG